MTQEKVLQEATAVFLIKDDTVLLARKTRGIGEGRRNAYGGGIEGDETLAECTVRELFDESKVRIDPANLEKVAVIDFHNRKEDGGEFTCRVHFYIVREWEGEPQATAEMEDPVWFPIEAPPVEEMMPADAFWLPRVLRGEKLRGVVHYAKRQTVLLEEPKFETVESFD